MAQLAERSAVNRQVPGSIPGGGASGSMAEWSKATDLSSVLHYEGVGSNPTRTIIRVYISSGRK